MYALLLLLLPIAAVTGWYAGYRAKSSAKNSRLNKLPRDYFIGLRYLIDEQPDKAVDVFIKMLEVNSDTVETHLALGSLFRRRGEVNRAIRIHQNLIARPQLTREQRMLALSALARDYLRAGVLDRAEKLFLELINLDRDNQISYKHLLDIYEQQKDWDKAIVVANKLQNRHAVPMQTAIAHYYCELNEPKKAIAVDSNCARASMLLAADSMQKGDYSVAIKLYKNSVDQDANYISEIIRPLATCYEQLGNEAEFVDYLQHCLERYPRISLILALAGFLRKHHNDFVAIEFITAQMNHYPSLRGLSCLTDIYVDNSEGNTKQKLLLLQNIMCSLLADKPIYRCNKCGFAGQSLFWHCPSCKTWGSVKPIHGIEGD